MTVNVAIALSQKGKRVVVVDLCPNGGNVLEHLGLKPERPITELLVKPIDTISRQDLEAALAVHPTGVRVLTIPPSREHEEISPSDADSLFERLREVTDYLVMDLPFPSSDLGEVALTKCDFIIIVTDSKADGLPNVKSTAALLGKLGVTQERVGAVIIDREAIFPEVEISKMKPTIELNTGVSLVGIIPYETKASLELVPGTPAILSDPNRPMAWSIREVAQHIIGEKISNQEPSQA